MKTCILCNKPILARGETTLGPTTQALTYIVRGLEFLPAHGLCVTAQYALKFAPKQTIHLLPPPE